MTNNVKNQYLKNSALSDVKLKLKQTGRINRQYTKFMTKPVRAFEFFIFKLCNLSKINMCKWLLSGFTGDFFLNALRQKEKNTS